MPFMLYDVRVVEGHQQYSYVRNIKLAGKTGPLARTQQTQKQGKDVPCQWHASRRDIIAAIPETTDHQDQEIVVDLKPTVAHNVSLYRLVDVWGVSDREWTPIALLLEVLFADRSEVDPSQFKKMFDLLDTKRQLVGEFLYLQGGVNGGTWNWGQVGRVNGALLWPDVFRYLVDELGQRLR